MVDQGISVTEESCLVVDQEKSVKAENWSVVDQETVEMA